MHTRELFFRHLAPTSEAPAGLEIVRAAGCYLYDQQEKAYLDLIAGISVCHLGHGHPAIKNSVQEQLDRYLHVMVYGEVILSPQVRYAEALTQLLPPTLDSVYFTNSGAEATEGAMKLAKRITGRTKIICFEAAYHGSTQGALSVIGSDYFQQTYRPLLPQVYRYAWQSEEVLTAIDTDTACVILELVQAEAGVRMADIGWLKALQQRCQASGTLLIVDEIQSERYAWSREMIEALTGERTGPARALEILDERFRGVPPAPRTTVPPNA